MGFLAIIQDDDDVSGLEAMDKSGSFVPIDTWPGTFLVNLGDMAVVYPFSSIQAWSNGRSCTLKHRVQCKEGRVRVSIGTFVMAQKEADIEAPEEFVNAEHPRLSAPISFTDYKKLRSVKKLHTGEVLALFQVASEA